MSKASTFLFFLLFIVEIQSKVNVRVTKIECEASKISITKFRCYLKAFNRRSPTVNIELFLNRTFEKAILTVNIFYKTQNDNPYQLITQAKSLEICKLIQGVEVSPFKLLADWMNSVLPGFNRICISTGQVNFNNVTISKSKFVEAFPEGFFKFIFKYIDNTDRNILTVVSCAVLTK